MLSFFREKAGAVAAVAREKASGYLATVKEKTSSLASRIFPASEELHDTSVRLNMYFDEARMRMGQQRQAEEEISPLACADLIKIRKLFEREERNPSSKVHLFSELTRFNVIGSLCHHATFDCPRQSFGHIVELISSLIELSAEKFFSEEASRQAVEHFIETCPDDVAQHDNQQWARFLFLVCGSLRRYPQFVSEFLSSAVLVSSGDVGFPLWDRVLVVLHVSPVAQRALVELASIRSTDLIADLVCNADRYVHCFGPVVNPFDRSLQLLSDRGFDVQSTSSEAIVRQLYQDMIFFDDILRQGHPAVCMRLQEMIGMHVDEVLFQPAVLLRQTEAQGKSSAACSIDLLLSATDFLREVFSSLPPSSGIALLFAMKIVSPPETLSVFVRRLSSANEALSLSTLRLFYSLLARHEPSIFFGLVSDYVLAAAGVVLRVPEQCLEVDSLPSQWHAQLDAFAQQCRADVHASGVLAPYFEDCSNLVSDCLVRYGVGNGQRSAPISDSDRGLVLHFRVLSASENVRAAVLECCARDTVVSPTAPSVGAFATPGNFLLEVFSLLRKWGHNNSEVNILLSGIVTHLCAVPCPVTQQLLLGSPLFLTGEMAEMDTLAASIAAAISTIETFPSFDRIQQTLPVIAKMLHVEGIGSSSTASVELGPYAPEQSPSHTTAPEGEKWGFEKSVLVMLELSKEILSLCSVMILLVDRSVASESLTAAAADADSKPDQQGASNGNGSSSKLDTETDAAIPS